MPKRTKSNSENSSPRKKKVHNRVFSQPRLDAFFSAGSSTPVQFNPQPVNSSAATQVIDVDQLEEEPPMLQLSELLPNPSVSSSQGLNLSVVSVANSRRAAYAPLAMDPVIYNPVSQPLSPSSIPYAFLTHAFVTLSQTRSRILIINTLTNTLRTIIYYHPPSLLPSLYLLSSSLAPSYASVELGLGSSIISRAIRNISGLSSSALKRLYNTTGDPGDVAFEAKSNLRTLMPHPPLLVRYVYENLLKIANCKGQGAAKQKEQVVEKLLVAAAGEEVRYLTRTLCQNLRVGAVRSSILTALARSLVLTPLSALEIEDESDTLHVTSELLSRLQNDPDTENSLAERYVAAEKLIKQVYAQHPNYDHIIAGLYQAGLTELARTVPLTIGVPLHPMLGSPVRSLQEIYTLLGELEFSAEYKYDGQRAQIHACKNDTGLTIKVFSRHLEDMTSKYPDVLSLVESMFRQHVNLRSFIIDSEIVAVDPMTGDIKTFQELSNRARKDVQLDEVRVAVCVYAFDLMLFNGDVLLKKPFSERRGLLRTQFPPFIPEARSSARFDHVHSCESTEGEDAILHFWQQSIEGRCEGVMIKLLHDELVVENNGVKKNKPRRKYLSAAYEADKRSSAWLKLKKDYVTGLGDTLDLIPIGAWHGNGRKVQWWSPILLGLWDPENGQPVAVCKCMSVGFTDAFYKALSERYSLTDECGTCSVQQIWDCDAGGFKPDVFFEPREVWEIRGADITISPVSTAARGVVSAERGLSIRFPRFLRVRGEKNVEHASTPSFLANMWKSQQSAHHERSTVDDELLLDTETDEADEGDIDQESEPDFL
ncbi:hypothetical protein AMATHDRAFT_137085 [Amanita thiersii Skay4041]|uniref:DNA ligase n=1 Tax=Amanita thiersii Skay4041 TaxID=703135 RepID=A0A2A9P0C2_9AGAR|nr:hypothetical protein AMATHDRAFT_137085 [Amanita thiersii Skay4041]